MNSPDYSASVSRLTREEHSEQALSGSLNHAIMGYLSIKVTFLGEPVSDLAVWFWDDNATPIPPRVGPSAGKYQYSSADDPEDDLAGWTNSHGEFCLPDRVAVGTYKCKIQGQPATDITTVEHAYDPFVVVLPIGRSYFDIYARHLREKDLPR